jgi:hypothetical protein
MDGLIATHPVPYFAFAGKCLTMLAFSTEAEGVSSRKTAANGKQQ